VIADAVDFELGFGVVSPPGLKGPSEAAKVEEAAQRNEAVEVVVRVAPN
jgi:hypothetical protein